jgi:hypothetical protein
MARNTKSGAQAADSLTSRHWMRTKFALGVISRKAEKIEDENPTEKRSIHLDFRQKAHYNIFSIKQNSL